MGTYDRGLVVYQTENLDWSFFLNQIADPSVFRGNLKAWQGTVARRARVSDRMVRALHEKTCCDPRFSTGVKILEAAARNRNEASKMASQIEKLAGTLNAKGSEEYGAMVLELIHQANRLRGLDRP
jgi:predicted transcriptional regulator